MLLSLSGDELLSAVDVIGCAREGGVGHNVYGERGHVRRSDHASDGKRGAKLVATFFELIAQQFRGQRRVHESRGDEVDSHGRDFKRQVSGEGGECSGDCASDAHADRWASTTSAAHEDQCSSRSHFVGRVARDVKCQQEVLVDKIAKLCEVHIGETSVVWPTGCHHHVVDCWEVTEEPIESNRIRGVEGRGLAARWRRSALRPVRITLAPSARARRAVSNPMPALPPITTTVCPRSSGSQWMEEGIVTVLIVPPIRTATRREDNTLALAVAVGHFVQVGLSELEAMSAVAGPQGGSRAIRKLTIYFRIADNPPGTSTYDPF